MIMNKYILQIKAAVDVKTALEYYGLHFNRANFAVCPFHNEKTASLSVKNGVFWKCFGCGASGDVISFVKAMLGLTTQEAVKRINADFDLGLPIESGTARERYEADRKLKKLEQEINARKLQRKSLEEAYDRAFDFWCAADKIVREHGNFASEEDSRAWAAAVNVLQYAEYKLDIAGINLNSFLLNGG